MSNFKSFLTIVLIMPFLMSCNFFDEVVKTAENLDKYEKAALNLAKENRILKAEVSKLEYALNELESKNRMLNQKLGRKASRMPASFHNPINKKDDQVKFDTYKWSAKDLFKIARSSFQKKEYDKSAQYYLTLMKKYPKSEFVNDQTLLEAGISGFEANKYSKGTLGALNKLIKEYPDSKYYRGAKLWRALAYFQIGDTNSFYQTVEEFRLKYRNTPEWTILSKHYEELTYKYKQ